LEIVKLRDHPLMKRKSGVYAWPPIWTTTRRDPDDKPEGEIGTLEQVLMSHVVDDVLFLVIRHQGFRYMGALGFDDPAFCRTIYDLLNSHIGLSIQEIGDLDLSHTL
jgi:hypothetical protein